MFTRVKIRESESRAGGRVIHTDPDGPPRYDLRKPKTLYDPDLDNTEEPDADISHDPLRIKKDDDPNLNMHDPDLDMGGVRGERSARGRPNASTKIDRTKALGPCIDQRSSPPSAPYSFPRLRLRN